MQQHNAVALCGLTYLRGLNRLGTYKLNAATRMPLLEKAFQLVRQVVDEELGLGIMAARSRLSREE